MNAELVAACERLADRKQAAFGEFEDGEIAWDVVRRNGIDPVEAAGRLLSGFDLDADELQAAARAYAWQTLELFAQGGILFPLVDGLAAGWVEGFLVGAFYLRELRRIEAVNESDPARDRAGSIPSARSFNVPSAYSIAGLYQRARRKLRGQT